MSISNILIALHMTEKMGIRTVDTIDTTNKGETTKTDETTKIGETIRDFTFTNPLDDPDCYLTLPPGFKYDIYGKVYRDDGYDEDIKLKDKVTETQNQNPEQTKPRKRCANCTCGAIIGKVCKRKAS